MSPGQRKDPEDEGSRPHRLLLSSLPANNLTSVLSGTRPALDPTPRHRGRDLKGAWPGRRDLPLFLLVGFLTVPATSLVQFWGLSLTGATVAALIVGCGPPMVAFFAHLFLGERLGKIGWSAIGASSVGVALAVARPGASNDWLGDALVLLSLLAVVGWVLLGKRLSDGYPAVPATAWILTFGTLTLAPVALLWEGVPRLDLTPLGWVSVLVLGLGCSAATYALWNWGVARVPASRAGVFLNLEPLVGALLGVQVLGEAWGPGTVFGGALIIGAAVVVSVGIHTRKPGPGE